MLDKIHSSSHLGISKCRERANQSIFWVGLAKELEQKVKNCEKCLIGRNEQFETLLPHEFPTRCWQRVATDLFEINKQIWLLVVDFYSRWIEIAKIPNSGARTVIIHMKSIFARHGIPEIVMSDNGTCFSSREFADFASNYDFSHITSSPNHSQSNGLAERSVQTVKTL